ncbi:Ci-Rhysin2/Deltex3-a [Pelomyxa schiedti]|nr:Ci-Rhysin2/Deltex3-a [Pelomyxa schiedti]
MGHGNSKHHHHGHHSSSSSASASTTDTSSSSSSAATATTTTSVSDTTTDTTTPSTDTSSSSSTTTTTSSSSSSTTTSTATGGADSTGTPATAASTTSSTASPSTAGGDGTKEKKKDKDKKAAAAAKGAKKGVFWKPSAAPRPKKGESEENCPVCLTELIDYASAPPLPEGKKLEDCEPEEGVVQLTKCGHFFHEECIKPVVEKNHLKCPICSTHYGIMTGNQPHGTMHVRTDNSQRLPGYEKFGTIVVSYNFPSGTQGPEHYHPGEHYEGTQRTGYFPDSPEGKAVIKLLQKAWDRKLLFTIGMSITHGTENVVIWNGIHHKTTTSGGETNHGYPDPTYLARVTHELASFGVVADEEE